MSNKTLPNLELLIYKAQQILLNDKDFVSAFSKVCAEAKSKGSFGYFLVPDFDVEVFSQTWSNAATGFDEPNTVSFQAITDSYTTVVHERITDTYVVFFNNKPCYKVNNPNEWFMNDLKNHCLKGIRKAKDAYQMIKVKNIAVCGFEQVDDLDDTERGTDGFGSTGR